MKVIILVEIWFSGTEDLNHWTRDKLKNSETFPEILAIWQPYVQGRSLSKTSFLQNPMGFRRKYLKYLVSKGPLFLW